MISRCSRRTLCDGNVPSAEDTESTGRAAGKEAILVFPKGTGSSEGIFTDAPLSSTDRRLFCTKHAEW
jgi:hypothetical protein